MQVNKISGYYVPKTNLNNIKTIKSVSFGEEHWCGDLSAIENRNREYQNRKINKFVKDAKDFDKFSKVAMKYFKTSAQKVYTQGENSDFNGEERFFDLKGEIYKIKCSRDGSKRITVLENDDDKMIFVFNKSLNGKLKDYSVVCGDTAYEKEYYKLDVTPERAVFVSKEAKNNKIQKITYNKNSTVYEEKDDIDSLSYESLIMKKFPHCFKPVYIENNGWSDKDIRYTYTYNPIKKNWDGILKYISKN